VTITRTRDISSKDWEEFLHVFSGTNRGRHARLEVAVPPGEGGPLLAEHHAFMGATFDSKGSGAPAITVTLGGTSPETPHLTHVVADPTHLWVEEGPDGAFLGLQIDSKAAGKTVLVFEPEKALPAQTTAGAGARA
jgi:hypothetical protein